MFIILFPPVFSRELGEEEWVGQMKAKFNFCRFCVEPQRGGSLASKYVSSMVLQRRALNSI